METNYEQQANDFLKSTNTEFSVKFLRNDKYFDDDKESRDIYEVTLMRGNRSYTFNFGQSLNDSGFYYTYGIQKKPIELPKHKEYLKDPKKGSELRGYIKTHFQFDLMPKDKIHYPEPPTAYDVLTCLTKYDPGTFENFCSDYGYDADSREAEKTYKAICDEYKSVCALYSDGEIELLSEIS